MQVQEGAGWRLALDTAHQPFPVLVGGQGWAAELTLAEARALRSGVIRLRDQHRSLEGQLMPGELVSLELELELELDKEGGLDRTSAEPGSLWLGLDADGSRWTLRFVLSPGGHGRGLEGGWEQEASAALAAALDLLALATV